MRRMYSKNELVNLIDSRIPEKKKLYKVYFEVPRDNTTYAFTIFVPSATNITEFSQIRELPWILEYGYTFEDNEKIFISLNKEINDSNIEVFVEYIQLGAETSHGDVSFDVDSSTTIESFTVYEVIDL